LPHEAERIAISLIKNNQPTKNMNNTETLKQRLDGTIILPGNPGYDEAR
jgi:hypothetical protein